MTLPSFTDPVPDNGYRWWYLDAVSDDGIHALTLIVFIGSVFSPYYARARKTQRTRSALQHCAVNVALYGPRGRWAMTERNQASVAASDSALAIGKSAIRIEHDELQVDIDEITVPLPSRLRGRIRIELPHYRLQPLALDTAASGSPFHYWQPVAPQTRINVQMHSPELEWQGAAYVDSNYGDIPLEKSFQSWTWSRSHGPHNQTTVLYDVVETGGLEQQRSMVFDAQGVCSTICAPQVHQLKPTRYWRIARQARTPAGVTLEDIQTLEDTPFYSRSRFVENHTGHQQVSVHESLNLSRFDSAWVQCLLPFRMPRSTRSVLRA